MAQLFDANAYNFTLYSLPTLVTSGAVLLLGVLAIFHERLSLVSFSFFVLTLTVAIWFFSYSWVYASVGPDVALWWARAAFLGIPFIAPSIYLFTVVALGLWRRNRLAVAGAWVVALLFAASELLAGTLFHEVRHFWWGYYPIYDWPGVLFLAFFTLLLGASMLHYRLAYVAAPPGTRKQRTASLMLAFGIGYLGAIDFAPAFGVPIYPFGYLPVLLFIALSARAIYTYRLVDITPAFAAREIVDTMGDALVVLDPERVMRVVNRACVKLLGLRKDDLLGKPMENAFNDALFTDQARFAQLLQAGTIDNYELSLGFADEGRKTKDESSPPSSFVPRTLSLSARVMHDHRGQPAAIVCIARDITEQKKNEVEIKRLNEDLERRVAERTRELEEAVRELEAFSYSVSHDLRAPLRSVTGFSNAVLEDYSGQLDERGERYLKLIRDSAQDMGRLIDDLLAFSRLGRQPMQRVRIDMHELARSVIEEQQLTGETGQAEFSVEHLPPTYGDRSMTKQVLVNLISNAVKFSRVVDRPCIHVGSECQDGQTVYYVRDNGVGFDMRYANKLFGVFQRLHSANQFEGTGVGLALVQRIVQRHGGRVWAEGLVNGGATFYFTIPSKGSDNGRPGGS